MTKLREINPGDVLVADDGFTCIPKGERLTVQDDGGRYVPCAHGRHYLDGRIDLAGHVVGLTKTAA